MKFYSQITKAALLTAALISMALAPLAHAADQEFSFKLKNTTKQTIKKLLVSEDGKSYGFFDIGNGIKAGETAKLVWDKSTNDGKCEQFFKAVFSDGEESEAVKFDFCEDDLELEF